MPDLIGHPEVNIGVQEWPHKDMGVLDHHFLGGEGWERGRLAR